MKYKRILQMQSIYMVMRILHKIMWCLTEVSHNVQITSKYFFINSAICNILKWKNNATESSLLVKDIQNIIWTKTHENKGQINWFYSALSLFPSQKLFFARIIICIFIILHHANSTLGMQCALKISLNVNISVNTIPKTQSLS